MKNQVTLADVQAVLKQAQSLIGQIEWTTKQCDSAVLGEHVNALETHIDNAIGRCSTATCCAEDNK